MSGFSDRSKANMAGVHPRLVQIASEITEEFDCSVIDGLRTIEQQQQNVAKGLSETLASKHLPQKDGTGHALDLAPTPQNWDASPPARVDGRSITMYEVELIAFLFYFKGYALARGLRVRIGADWNGNNLWDALDKPNPFNDLDHVELLNDHEPLDLLPPPPGFSP